MLLQTYCARLAMALGGGYREYTSMRLDELIDLIEVVSRINAQDAEAEDNVTYWEVPDG